MITDRRDFLIGLVATLGASSTRGVIPPPAREGAAIVPAAAPAVPAAPALADSVPLLGQAMAALDRHAGLLRDRLAIADFSLGSARPRFHLVDLAAGEANVLHVCHGSGSDPGHTGFLQRFSNQPGSNASSEGAYATRGYYVGNHGHSQRLEGLDATNSNAMDRAIVLHAAWYAEPEVIARTGKLGRSQGCLAFAESDLAQVFAFLGEGRLIFSGRSATA